MQLRLLYFARVREAIGLEGEDRDLPDSVRTVDNCVRWLATQGEKYESAFADRERLRFALDRQMVGAGVALEGASELAIFPPVTGG
jgi:sulfur-carrier protein